MKSDKSCRCSSRTYGAGWDTVSDTRPCPLWTRANHGARVAPGSEALLWEKNNHLMETSDNTSPVPEMLLYLSVILRSALCLS